ncbi:hypothetical protein E2C01_062461 [Portunus trituberculatus]|uniref:Uncharacterized protein n=1 Tax=Portunus trituberculatus TaxID=210409 RepID=A0A5B7HDQ5_PORTR|nr:hypothetical protein [Portunus trituberculatus]
MKNLHNLHQSLLNVRDKTKKCLEVRITVTRPWLCIKTPTQVQVLGFPGGLGRHADTITPALSLSPKHSQGLGVKFPEGLPTT